MPRLNRIIPAVLLSLLCLGTAGSASAVHLGVGVSSVHDGRLIPALNLGFTYKDEYVASATSTGVATEAYYSSAYTLSGMKRFMKTKYLFGEFNADFGGGIFYAQKAVLEDPLTDEEAEDTDFNVGPAFRVEVVPLPHFYMAFEYVMGIGFAVLGNGWGDAGVFVMGGTF